MVSIPPRTLNFACIAFSIMGSMGFPSRNADSKSDSEAENKQFLSRPLAIILTGYTNQHFRGYPKLFGSFHKLF